MCKTRYASGLNINEKMNDILEHNHCLVVHFSVGSPPFFNRNLYLFWKEVSAELLTPSLGATTTLPRSRNLHNRGIIIHGGKSFLESKEASFVRYSQ